MRKTFTLIFTVATVFAFTNVSFGQTQAPNLRSTSSFAFFTADGAFTVNGSTTVTGDVGTNAGAFTGFPPGTLIGNKRLPGSPEAIQAASDVLAAYNSLSPVTCDRTIAAELAGQTITPGVSCQNTASPTTLNGTLTLSGSGIFIIKTNSALVTGTNSNIVLTGGANANNVFFLINGAFTAGTSSALKGTFLVNGAIVLGTGASLLNGRGLSIVGAITLNDNFVARPLAPPDLTPNIILPQANFLASGLNSVKNFTVEIYELGGQPTVSGSVVFTITPPFGYSLVFDGNRTTIDISGGATNKPIENPRWTASTNGAQLQMTMKAGQSIPANGTATMGFTITRTIANPGASANITVGITDDAAQVYDSVSANNIYSRIINALAN